MKPSILLLTSVLCLGSSFLQGAVVLAVDFQGDPTPGPPAVTPVTQAGFQSYTSTSGNQTYTGVSGVISNSVVVSLPNGGSSRYRSAPTTNSGSFTQSDLLRDLYTGLHPNSQTALTANYTLSLTGLDPGAQYIIQIFSLDADNNNGVVAQWYDSTATPVNTPGQQSTDVLLGSVTNNSGGNVVLVDNNSYSVTGVVTANSSGAVHFKLFDAAGTGQINGFVLSTIPEPTHVSLLALGVASLLFGRRRK